MYKNVRWLLFVCICYLDSLTFSIGLYLVSAASVSPHFLWLTLMTRGPANNYAGFSGCLEWHRGRT